MAKGNYITLIDNEPYSFKCPHELQLVCCDCGLTHVFKFKIRDKELIFKVKRNDRITAQLRRYGNNNLQKNSDKWKMIRNGRKKRYVKSRKK